MGAELDPCVHVQLAGVTDAVRDRQEKKSASYSRAGVLNGYATVKRNLAVSYNQTT